MNSKEFNTLLNEVAFEIGKFNQLLFELVFIVSLYILFNNMKNNVLDQKYFDKNQKSIIFIIIVFGVSIDWFIWQNIYQTLLFLIIISLYASYNLDLFNNYASFIVSTEKMREGFENKMQKQYINLKNQFLEQKKTQKDKDEITFVPRDISYTPRPTIYSYDKLLSKVSELNQSYHQSSNIPNGALLNENPEADTVLTALYESPQYININQNDIDSYLDNNIHKSDKPNIPIDSFRTQPRDFLDKNWDRKYYVAQCEGNNVKFGNKLWQCTNEEGSVTKEQLKNISSNNITPITLNNSEKI